MNFKLINDNNLALMSDGDVDLSAMVKIRD